MTTQKLGAGWGRPEASKKFHYFPADDPMMSLCRKWGFYGGDRDDVDHDHPLNCAECKRRHKKLLAQAS